MLNNWHNGWRKKGGRFYFDKKIQVGRQWRPEIEMELNAAKAVVVLWSTQSYGSPFVMDEAEHGKENNILFPVFIEERVRAPLGFRGFYKQQTWPIGKVVKLISIWLNCWRICTCI